MYLSPPSSNPKRLDMMAVGRSTMPSKIRQSWLNTRSNPTSPPTFLPQPRGPQEPRPQLDRGRQALLTWLGHPRRLQVARPRFDHDIKAKGGVLAPTAKGSEQLGLQPPRIPSTCHRSTSRSSERRNPACVGALHP